jgi:hypothetical protein
MPLRTKVISPEGVVWVERAVSSLRELVRLKINVYPVGGLRRGWKIRFHV